MFDAIEGVKIGYILCGIIWAVALGFAVGNYACSLVHRLPRGRLILDKKPYCGSCGTLLQTRDLFPVFSGVMLRHRCRYCKAPYPVSHTWTELLVGLLFVLTYFKYGFSEQFLLVACIGVFLITLAAIHVNEGIVMGKVVLCLVVFGMLWRTLHDGSIYGFFAGGFLGLVVGAVLWCRKIRPEGHIYTLPKPVELLAVGGLCVGVKALPLFFALFAGFYALDWLVRKIMRSSKLVPMTVAFGFAVMLPLLYPDLLVIVTKL